MYRFCWCAVAAACLFLGACDAISVSDVTIEVSDVGTGASVPDATVSFVADNRRPSVSTDGLFSYSELVDQFGLSVGPTDAEGRFHIATVGFCSPTSCMQAFQPNHWVFEVTREEVSELLVMAPVGNDVAGLPDFVEAEATGSVFALHVLGIDCEIDNSVPLPSYIHKK
jgi:hypothetical protein